MTSNLSCELPSLLKTGYQYYRGSDEVIIKNIAACKALSDITRTSMGPNGMNKIVTDHLDKFFVTCDTSTIVNNLDIVHPASRLLVMAANSQYREIGDGTNFVIIMAGELLGFASALIHDGVHASEITDGYRIATIEALKDLEILSLPGSEKFDNMNEEEVVHRIKGCISSKKYGYENSLCRLVARACIDVSIPNTKKFTSEKVRVAKIIGGGIEDSTLVKGLVIERDSDGSIKLVRDPRVVIYAQNIDTCSSETTGTVLFQNPDDLLNYNKDEEARLEQVVKEIVKSGATVVVAGSPFSDVLHHLLEKFGLMFMHVSSKFELQRICQATGCNALVKNGPPTGDELGSAQKIQVRDLGGVKCIIIEQDIISSRLTTIVLRSATHQILDDLERAVNSGVNAYRALCMDSRTVPGGGATEMEIARSLTVMAGFQIGLEQYAIQKFAEALEIIPRTLAENSGHCAIQALSALWSAHSSGKKYAGLDVESGEAADLSKDGILDLFIVKWWALKILSDTVLTLLKIDHIIMAKQAAGETSN